jgi:hypothetical protein
MDMNMSLSDASAAFGTVDYCNIYSYVFKRLDGCCYYPQILSNIEHLMLPIEDLPLGHQFCGVWTHIWRIRIMSWYNLKELLEYVDVSQ